MSVLKKIFNERLYFRENASSKVNSLENVEHQPKSSDKQIYTEQLPWLRYNKPNLPEHVKEQINQKQYSLDHSTIYATTNSSDTDHETPSKNIKVGFPTLSDENRESKVPSKLSTEKIEQNRSSETKKEVKKSTEKRIQAANHPENINRQENPKIKENNTNPVIAKATNNVDKSKLSKNEKVNFPPKKKDASTETNVTNAVSVEIQTTENPKSLQTRKLKNALKNSNTFDNNYSSPSNGEKHYGKSRIERTNNDKKEAIITSRVIETFLPSISFNEKENKTFPKQSYSYFNNNKSLNSKSTNFPPTKHLVTHAGINFLDQYWASQRWLMLNKEINTQQHDHYESKERLDSETEIPSVLDMKVPKYSDHRDKQNFRDLFNGRIRHYSDSCENISNRQSPSVDRITTKDLNKLII